MVSGVLEAERWYSVVSTCICVTVLSSLCYGVSTVCIVWHHASVCYNGVDAFHLCTCFCC